MLTMTTMTTTKKNEKETTIDDDDEDPRDRIMPIRSSESGMGLGRSTGARESLIGTRGQRGTICSLSVSGYREAGSLTRRECTVDSELREQVILEVEHRSPAEVEARADYSRIYADLSDVPRARPSRTRDKAHG